MHQQLYIGKSLHQIWATLTSEWRMFVRIGWFPLTVSGVLLCLARYLHWDNHEWQYRIILHGMVGAVFLTGVCRYVLNDPRFHLKTITFKKNMETGRPVLAMRLYFACDKNIIILALILMSGAFLSSYSNHMIATLTFSDAPFPPTISYALLADSWKIVLFSLASQLCLIFPYIAISEKITLRKAVENVKVLQGQRIRIWAVQALLAVCGIIMAISLGYGFGTLYRNTGYNSLISLGDMLGELGWFMNWLVSAIFFAAAFNRLGIREDKTE